MVYFIGERFHMHRAVIDRHLVVAVDPGRRVLHPFFVVAVRDIVSGVRAARFLPVGGGVERHHRLFEQILEFQGFHQIRIPDHGTVGNLDVVQAVPDLADLLAPFY